MQNYLFWAWTEIGYKCLLFCHDTAFCTHTKMKNYRRDFLFKFKIKIKSFPSIFMLNRLRDRFFPHFLTHSPLFDYWSYIPSPAGYSHDNIRRKETDRERGEGDSNGEIRGEEWFERWLLSPLCICDTSTCDSKACVCNMRIDAEGWPPLPLSFPFSHFSPSQSHYSHCGSTGEQFVLIRTVPNETREQSIGV